MIWKNEERIPIQPLFLLDEIQTSIPWNVSDLDDSMKISVCFIGFFSENFLSLGKTSILHRSWNSLTWICNLFKTFQKHTPKHSNDCIWSLFDNFRNHILSTLQDRNVEIWILICNCSHHLGSIFDFPHNDFHWNNHKCSFDLKRL